MDSSSVYHGQLMVLPTGLLNGTSCLSSVSLSSPVMNSVNCSDPTRICSPRMSESLSTVVIVGLRNVLPSKQAPQVPVQLR